MPRWFRRITGVYCALWLVALVVTPACRRAPSSSTSSKELAKTPVAHATAQTSESCRTCHAEIFKAWSETDHALANRLATNLPEGTGALATFPDVRGRGEAAVAKMILGNKPSWQPLIEQEGGRWQPHEQAYDPAKKEWFSVFGDEKRRPDEWGHWSGRGMNWNSMCAHCHMTGYQKNYDVATDRYHSTWVEQGVGCIQCHGPTSPGHGTASGTGAKAMVSPTVNKDRHVMMQTCAPCHARNELLTDTFQPGDAYHDHFRVTLPAEPGVFYPDGQQRDEDFNWTSVLVSRMGHAGVTCMDCHDPHTNKTILPVTNNALCMQCHTTPGRVMAGGARAVPIDPLTHSRHAEGSVGNQCVSCHMPTTTYMQRSPRHDHGWLKPDPLMTQELGIPNACNSCHTDKTVAWAVETTDAWYGSKMDSRQRARARAVAAAQANRPDAAPALLTLLANEDIPAWRATYLQLLSPYQTVDSRIITEARARLASVDPLERSSAVRLLSAHGPSFPLLRPLLKDPVRLVRLDAAWALSRELAAGSPERVELDRYLALSLDQPAGRLRLGQDLANRGLLPQAETEIRLASGWDPHSPGILDAHGLVLSALGRGAEAGAQFYRSALLQPSESEPALRAALAYAEAGKFAEAETSLRMAVERNPSHDRAWYNLGLLYAQGERLPEAMNALRKAETLAPRVPDYSYALATILLRQGDRAGAEAAARRALASDPSHGPSRQLLGIR
ncbi:MAG TPA: tetratricopeptide repeat protein [Opitutaceae bacterium]|nr:tetratricopeptide repeat protein [Opitutaceae bacterium]